MVGTEGQQIELAAPATGSGQICLVSLPQAFLEKAAVTLPSLGDS